MKNNSAFKLIKAKREKEDIESKLVGYWKNDRWDTRNSLFEQYNNNEKSSKNKRYIDFSILPVPIRSEMKYWAYTQLSNDVLKLNTLKTHSAGFKFIKIFLEKHYSEIHSFAEIPIEKGLLQYKTILIENDIDIEQNRYYIANFKEVFNFFFNLFDSREEFEKDIWNAKNIPNARYTKNSSQYLLDFRQFQKPFNELVKSYAKLQITLLSVNTLQKKIRGLKYFFEFLYKEHPEWTNLTKLNRVDIENYLSYFKQKHGDIGENNASKYINSVIDFIEYLQKSEYKESPKQPVFKLFFKEDLPKRTRSSENQIKYIPECVLNQLEMLLLKNQNELNPPLSESDKEYIPIISLLMATGWRVSDILNLRYDNCLLTTSKGFYLQGDIPKIGVKDHRIPISKEIALILQSAIEHTTRKSDESNNPNKYLFVRTSGTRKGNPIDGRSIQKALNRWAKLYNIVNQDNQIYHFKNHAFRHSKGMELINNGMNVMHIMKWFAHSSPEMTLNYAKIAEDTLRKEWEKAQEKKGPLVRIDLNNGAVNEMELDEDLIHWEYIKSNVEAVRVPLGYCLASKKEGCPFVVTPCLTCPNFCTTPDNLNDFDKEIARVEEHIEITKNYPIYNEKTKEQLENLIKVRNQLAQGRSHRGDSAKKVLFQSEQVKESKNENA